MPNKTVMMMDDTAVCFQCGLALDGWEEGDDPHLEHAKRRPECPFVKKGVALHPCSFEFLLGSKPDTNAIRHISSSSTNARDTSAGKFKLPPPRRDTKKTESANSVGDPKKTKESIEMNCVEAASTRKSLGPFGSRKNITSIELSERTIASKSTFPDSSESFTAQSGTGEVSATPRTRKQSVRRTTTNIAKALTTNSKIATTESATERTQSESCEKENIPQITSKRRRTTMARSVAIDDRTTSLLGVTAAQASIMTVEEYISMLQTRKLEEFDTKAKEILANFSNSAHL